MAKSKQPAKRTPMELSEAVESGDRLDQLLATRRIVAAAVASSTTSARDLAALTRRLDLITTDIETLEAAEKEKLAAAAAAAASADEAFDPTSI